MGFWGNAAEDTRKEEKAVTAAEVAAPDNEIDGAPDQHLFLPAKPIRVISNPFPLSFLSSDVIEKGDPTPQGRAAPGTPTGSAHMGSKIGSSEMRSDSVALQKSVSQSVPIPIIPLNSCIDPVKL